MSTSLSYRDAGVDIDAGDQLVENIKPFAKRTMRPEVLGDLGGFGALVEISKKYKNPVLVSGTDGVGTKLKLAFDWDKHDTVGIDLVDKAKVIYTPRVKVKTALKGVRLERAERVLDVPYATATKKKGTKPKEEGGTSPTPGASEGHVGI